MARGGKPAATSESDEARFWAKVDKDGANGCWLWTAGTERGYGYLQIHRPTKRYRMRAHRMSYELAYGPIPSGLVIDHLCHVATCVNPDHLRAVTQQVNSANRAGPRPNSMSGILNVYWVKRQQRWRVSVIRRGKVHHGGSFADLGRAAQAAKALREKFDPDGVAGAFA